MADPQEAVSFVNDVIDAESDNRTRGEFNFKFSHGVDQWPGYAIAARGMDRPRLTVNELDSYIRQVANNQRQQRPRGKAHPVDSKGDVKVAKVVTGLGRHIEVHSDADHAYDTAFDHALRIGWGYWRLRTDYVRPDSFDQEIYIDTVDNPLSVYFDPLSTKPDGSDGTRCVLTFDYSRKDFEKEFPGIDLSNFTAGGAHMDAPDWVTKDTLRIAEYYYTQRIKAKLIKLSDGTIIWEDAMPDTALLAAVGLTVVGDRESMKTQIKWQKQTASTILEEKDIPGMYIPVVPVYGMVAMIDGYRRKFGLVENAKDPQIMINFWNTSITESYALAPKAKWLLPEGTDEDHEEEWANANLSASPVLRYKPTDVMGNPAKPERIQPQAPEAAMINSMMEASRNLQKVLGIFDPAMAATSPKSGKAVIAEKMQAENSNFHYYDNLTRSIKHTWRIMLGWYPHVYDTERAQRIIGEDGKPEIITINERTKAQPDGENDAIEKVLNCVCVGDYDVVMESGPGYDTKRQEGVEAMVSLMQSPIGEMVAKFGADILVRQIDAPQMDVLADRLAAANPMSKIDEQSDVPPQAQMAMMQMQEQLKQMQGALQQAEIEKKYRLDAIQLKEQGDTKRALMKVTADTHEAEITRLSKEHDVEARAITAQNVAEISGIVQLLVKHIDTRQLEAELAARNAEQQIKHDEQSFTPMTQQ